MTLEGKGLGFRYHSDVWLFRNVDVTINPGEVIGLFGPSGCGKTTLGRILAGFEVPKEGAVTVDGRPVTEWEGYHPVQMVFQHPERSVNPRWRIRKTLYEGWEPDGVFLERLGIEGDWLDRWPNELSGGQLQRICIARALGHKTRYLIADEITTMLDSITQAQIWHALLDVVRERKLGMLVISHDGPLLRRICDRILAWEALTWGR